MYPQAMLFQSVVKAHMRGAESHDDSKEMFDPSTGKTYVPFTSSIKVVTTTQLMYCVHTYVTTMIGLKNEAPRVYFEFVRDVARVADDKGARFAQEYVDLLLRYLDDKRFPSMVTLYNTGEPSRTFTELAARQPLPDKSKLGADVNSAFMGRLDGPNGRCKFGPVTTPVGGKGAGWIPRSCNRFHATPSRPCTAGIPEGEGFPSNIVGLCAFQH